MPLDSSVSRSLNPAFASDGLAPFESGLDPFQSSRVTDFAQSDPPPDLCPADYALNSNPNSSIVIQATPIQRFASASEEPQPWSQLHVTGIPEDNPTVKPGSQLQGRRSRLGPQNEAPPRSENGSHTNATDSGYHSLSTSSQPGVPTAFVTIQTMFPGPSDPRRTHLAVPNSQLSQNPVSWNTAAPSDIPPPQPFVPAPQQHACAEEGCNFNSAGKTPSEIK